MNAQRGWLNGAATYPNAELIGLPPTLRTIFTSGAIPEKFFNDFSADNTIGEVRGIQGRRLARFGSIQTGDPVAVDLNTFEVVHVQVRRMTPRLVNSTLEAFSSFMKICEENYPYYTLGAGFDSDPYMDASNRLRSKLDTVDALAFWPGSFWSDFLSDVGNGDYGKPSDEDDEDEDW